MTCLDPSFGKWALTLSLPNLAKSKFRPNFQILFCKILKNLWLHVKVQAESFHLNGHIIGFHPQTQKLESPYKTPSNTLAVKGLKVTCPTRKYTNPWRPDETFFELWMCLNSSPWWSNPESYPQLTNWWLEFVADTLLEDVINCSRYVKITSVTVFGIQNLWLYPKPSILYKGRYIVYPVL